jgi:hypothetical protein
MRQLTELLKNSLKANERFSDWLVLADRRSGSRSRCGLQSQRHTPGFRQNPFFSLMRLQGIECNTPSGYVEAFYYRKLVL